jgi:hypothetical protein
MYLSQIAGYYSFVLTPEQMGHIGVVWLIVIALILIFGWDKKLRPPTRGGFHPNNERSLCQPC